MVTDKYSGYIDFSPAHNGGRDPFTSQQAVPINTQCKTQRNVLKKMDKIFKIKKKTRWQI